MEIDCVKLHSNYISVFFSPYLEIGASDAREFTTKSLFEFVSCDAPSNYPQPLTKMKF
jgi:hypothetical protein